MAATFSAKTRFCPAMHEIGKSAKSCQAPFAKIFLFFRMANQV
jgi:hypothetical protein